MMAGKRTIKSLKRRIEGCMEKSESGRYFLPKLHLSHIFTLDEIEEAVDELSCPIEEKIGLAQEIYHQGARVFAILIKNGEEDLITQFRKHCMLKIESPLDVTLAGQVAGDFGSAFAQEYQWQFLPYEFGRNMRDHCRTITYDKMILPFVGDTEVIASGGFGDITRVKIHPSQHEFTLDKVSWFSMLN